MYFGSVFAAKGKALKFPVFPEFPTERLRSVGRSVANAFRWSSRIRDAGTLQVFPRMCATVKISNLGNKRAVGDTNNTRACLGAVTIGRCNTSTPISLSFMSSIKLLLLIGVVAAHTGVHEEESEGVYDHGPECGRDDDWDEDELIRHHGPDFRRHLQVGADAELCSLNSNTPDARFSALSDGAPVYKLRAVVHLTAAGTSFGDFSDQCVLDAIDQLNGFLRGRSGGVDSKIEVELTKLDEQGRACTGIERYYDSALAVGYNGAVRRDILKAVQWNPERFINILSYDTDGGFNGMATLAASPTRHTVGDVIVMGTNCFTACASHRQTPSTFAHEVGHCACRRAFVAPPRTPPTPFVHHAFRRMRCRSGALPHV